MTNDARIIATADLGARAIRLFRPPITTAYTPTSSDRVSQP
jgi:hypothetical protein